MLCRTEELAEDVSCIGLEELHFLPYFCQCTYETFLLYMRLLHAGFLHEKYIQTLHLQLLHALWIRCLRQITIGAWISL